MIRIDEAARPAPTLAELTAALEATWPPCAVDDVSAPGWRLRDGGGGGRRVSAATALRPDADPAVAEAAMRRAGRTPLFRVSSEEGGLDAALAARGYAAEDPTLFFVGDAARLAAQPLPDGVRTAQVRARLALLDEIWDEGGVGPERRAIMERAPTPKTVLMARTDLAVAGCGFVALHGGTAMLHAVEVRADRRREGGGRALVVGAARFALDHGAPTLALAVTEANRAARALYSRMGMTEAGGYRYRTAAD